MVAQPVPEEFIWNADVRYGVLDSIQMNGGEPGVIDLFRHLSLNVMKSLLPNRVDAHNPLNFLYTGLYTPVDNQTLTPDFLVPEPINRSLIIM